MGERKRKAPERTRTTNQNIFRTVPAKILTDGILRIYSSQERKRERNSAHDSGHLLRTGIAAARYSRKKKDKDAARLAAVTGLLHDFVRSPREVEGRSDGMVTADLLKYMVFGKHKQHEDHIREHSRLESLYPEEMKILRTFLQSIETEIVDIADAIALNERGVFEIIRAIIAFKTQGRMLDALIQEALLYGDQGVEGVGPSVVVRRAQFVSGERAENPEDVGAMRESILSSGFSENEFRLLAFMGESMIRMYATKVIDDFPEGKIWDELKDLRRMEASVYHSLRLYFLDRGPFKEETDIFQFLSQKGFPRMDAFAERILLKMPPSDFTRPLLSGRIRDFVTDSINLILALAYSQSGDEELRKKSSRHMRQVRNPSLTNILNEAGTEILKNEFIWLLEQ